MKNPKRRKNPFKHLPPAEMSEDLRAFMADSLVLTNLKGATFEERVLVSGMIPSFLQIIRSGADVSVILEDFATRWVPANESGESDDTNAGGNT